ncbi:alpha/beta fold hydrolase [Desulfosporosinus sp. SYSU MS00001]|uniref:alpha/beta fold hydrolase n=1 Tax=Desulfosporosinus sp. SYSU MS00001 TaxID=3416284 RepID=UPI003CEAB08D
MRGMVLKKSKTFKKKGGIHGSFQQIIAVVLCILMIPWTISPAFADQVQNDGKNVAVTKETKIERIAGNDRYQTAIAISKQMYPQGSGTVILARGNDFPDALAGVPLAHKLNAPLLLTDGTSLNKDTEAEIIRLNPQKIYILGGPVVIPETVESELKDKGRDVKRLGGVDRYDTASLIAQELGFSNGKAVLAYGENFPDALAVSSWAAYNDVPILLTETNELPTETLKALQDLNVTSTYIIGGKAVISERLEESLKEYNMNPTRYWGNDRYETAIAVAQGLKTDNNHLFLATGLNFPDALAGGVMAAQANSSLLLVDTNIPSNVSNYLCTIKDNISTVYILGGKAVVSDDIVNSLKNINSNSLTLNWVNNSQSSLSNFNPSTQVSLEVKSNKSDVTFAWSATGGTLANKSGATNTWTLPNTAGDYTVTVEAQIGDVTKTISRKITVLSVSSGGYGGSTSPTSNNPFLSISESGGSILLSWDKVDCYKEYTVLRKINSSTYSAIAGNIVENSYKDIQLNASGVYKYKLQAIKNDNSIVESNEVSSFVIDGIVSAGQTDSDNDGLPDDYEKKIASDPNNPDTDNDGLPDGYEVSVLGTDPTKTDSNDNGTSDALEDFDSDGLNNLNEYLNNTNPFKSDTDGDGLSDNDEINVYKTNPLMTDTDGDQLSDGSEIKLGFDPLMQDTDGNGTIDSLEKTTQKVDLSRYSVGLLTDDNPVKPDISITSAGDINNDIIVNDDINDPLLVNNRAIVGHPIDVHFDKKFDHATITFTLDKNQLSDSYINNYSIFWLDDEGKMNQVKTTIDPINNSLSAEVTHFSRYMVINVKKIFADMGSNDGTVNGQADIVFCVDTTGSMGDNIENVKNNIASFVTNLNSAKVSLHLGLVDYKDITCDGLDSTKVHKDVKDEWYTDVDKFKDELSKLGASGGGDTPECAVDALETTRQMSFRTNATKFIILVTDANYKVNNNFGIPSMDEEISKLKSDNIIVSVIGDPYDQADYENLYIDTNGIFGDIYSDFSDLLDTLKDKIASTVNDGYWICLANLENVKLLKAPEATDLSTDSDSDGIPDSQELLTCEPTDLVIDMPFLPDPTTIKVYSFKSNPANADTDGDGYNDSKDLNPLIPFKTPVMLLHGRTDNTYACFGVQTNLYAYGHNLNNEYGSDLDSSGTWSFTDYKAQEITNIVNSDGSKTLQENIGYELEWKGYKPNKNLFAFNYPNQDMVYLNAEKFKGYIESLLNHMSDDDLAGYIYPTINDQLTHNAKFNIIAHSMGGLVSRYYIENLGGSDNVNKLITIDTPHWGSGEADLSEWTPLFIPCDVDLDPSAKIYGGTGFESSEKWYYNAKGNYAVTHQTDQTKIENSPGDKYYFIAGYDDVGPEFLPDDLKDKTLSFDVNLDSSNFTNFRNSIAEGFYAKYGHRDDIVFDFTMIGGDNVVNNQSQFGIRFPSDEERTGLVPVNKTSMTIDTIFGHWVQNNFHSQNQHRIETINKVIDYINN